MTKGVHYIPDYNLKPEKHSRVLAGFLVESASPAGLAASTIYAQNSEHSYRKVDQHS